MEKIKDNIFAKIIAFIVLQICVVTIAISGVVVAFNATCEWYSSNKDEVKETILQEIAWEVEYEIHDRLHYEMELNDGDVYWPAYFTKGTELPEGIGYEITFPKLDKNQLKDIALKKNKQSLSKLQGTYSSSVNDDLYELTIYVGDPEEIQKPASEIYPQNMATRYELYNNIYHYRMYAIASGAAAIILMILLFAFLIVSIEREKEIKGFVDKAPADLILCLAMILIVCAAALISELIQTYNFELLVLGVVVLAFVISVIATGSLLFCITKAKRGQWWKSTFIFCMLKLLRKVLVWCISRTKSLLGVLASGVRKLPLVWKTAVITAAIMISNLIIAINISWSGFAAFCWVAGAFVISVGVIYIALCMKRLKKAAEKLAAGDLDHKVDKKGLFWDFADHADNLNRIGDGMSAAVEERIKSERFKAELITNVSHDIKTPLTSIINYVDLLKKENLEDEKSKEYIDVLDRQSKRLKKLTEDIVDASKASTGNVKMDFAPCKVGLLMSQTMAEYKEKAEAEGLDFIMKLPEEDLEIFADGRRLWRVFDNLLNNICKYGQPGTRVYMTLEAKEEKAVITYRNVSKYELNITEEELMERFVRGDKSRNTEGSGLGLSIARNLVELQNGEFDIYIDGDLFKVVLKFNLLNL